MYENMGNHVNLLTKPPLNIEGAQTREESAKSLEAQVNALLMSISVAMARINAMQATNSSGALNQLATNYMSLQLRAFNILHALSDPAAAASCITALSIEQAHLNSQLYQNIFDAEKLAAEENANKPTLTLDELEAALNNVPAMNKINIHIGELNKVKKKYKKVEEDFKETEKGFDDFDTTMQATTVVEDEKTMAAVLDVAALEMAEKALKEEEELIKAGAEEVETEEKILTRRERVKAAIRERAKNIHATAKDIHEGMRSHFTIGKERVLNAYGKFVAEPAKKFAASYPEYCEMAKNTIGERAASWGARFKKFDERLQNMHTAIESAADNVALEQNIKTQINGIKEEFKSVGHELDTQAAIIEQELELAHRQKIALENLLTGKSDDLKGTAKLLGMKETDLLKEVGEFRAKAGIETLPTQTAFKNVLDSLNSWLNAFRGQGMGGKGGVN